DRDLRRVRIAGAERPPLRPRARVLERLEIRRRRGGGRIQPEHQPRLVHHLEHVGDAALRLAYQPAVAGAALAEVQSDRGQSPPAHLMKDARADAVVVAAVEALFRDGEERDALDPGRRALDT